MDADQIKGAVNAALPLRPPKWDEGVSGSVKIAELEDYLMESAYAQAELEEALHYIDALVALFKAKIEDMTGFQAVLPNKRAERITKEDVLLAKRRTDPVTFELGAEMRLLRATAIRQIDRLRFEAQFVVSRCYTLISGS